MKHRSLVKDAAARSGLPEATVERVVAALADVVHHAHATPDELLHALLGADEPLHAHPVDPRDAEVVADLVEGRRSTPSASTT
jgi:hypothetical protein